MKPANAWQKGQSGNPSGRPKLPEQTQRLRELGKIEAIEALSKVMTLTMAQLSMLPKDPTASAAMLLAGSVMHKAIKTGCPIRANFIFQYMVGRPETSQAETEPADPEQNQIRLAYSRDDL